MSRFFATGGSDSESDSDSEREQIVQRPAPAAFTVNSNFKQLEIQFKSCFGQKFQQFIQFCFGKTVVQR